jgi:chorismate mutase
VAGDFTATYDLWAQASYPEHRLEIYDPEESERVIAALRRVPEAGLGAHLVPEGHSVS